MAKRASQATYYKFSGVRNACIHLSFTISLTLRIVKPRGSGLPHSVTRSSQTSAPHFFQPKLDSSAAGTGLQRLRT